MIGKLHINNDLIYFILNEERSLVYLFVSSRSFSRFPMAIPRFFFFLSAHEQQYMQK